MGPILILII